MPTTAEALILLLIALLPGAIYTWSFERIAGRWGIGLSDRLYRFIGISALFHVLVAPATYSIWRHQIRDLQPDDVLPLWLWFAALAFVAVPGCLGSVVGWGHARNRTWAKALVGPTAAPTAWDAVFAGNPVGSLILMKLRRGEWIGGEFADGSYAGGFPEPADLYLSRELAVDQTTCDFIRDDDGNPLPVSSFGLLVRWEEVEYLEIAD